MYYSPIQTKSPATNQFAKVSRKKSGIIEKGFIHKRRQRSSLLFGVRIDSIPCPTGYFAPRWQVHRKGWIHQILHFVLVQIIIFFISSLCNSSYSSNRHGAKELARQEIKSIPPPKEQSTTFAFSSALYPQNKDGDRSQGKQSSFIFFLGGERKWRPPDLCSTQLIRGEGASVTLT